MRHDNRHTTMRRKRQAAKKRRTRFRRLLVAFVIFWIGYGAFHVYDKIKHPYCVAIDAGHGGADVGAVGIINEVELTESTAELLVERLKEDGRFRVLQTREKGETMDIDKRCEKLRKWQPDIMLSIHGNADDRGSGRGFECYPSVPGAKNHDKSMEFAQILAQEIENQGHSLRGIAGIRFGYYRPTDNGMQKWITESTDTTVYDYDTFGVLKKLDGAAVLVEQCFVTNAADVNNFGTKEGCQKAADAYYAAIVRYCGLDAPV